MQGAETFLPERALRPRARTGRRIGIREHLHVDVDHHLIALARGAGFDAVVQCRFREKAERVRLLLRHGRRFRGNVDDARARGDVPGLLGACPLVELLASRGQRLDQHGADLGLEPSADHDHAVFALIHVKRAAPVPPGGLLRLCLAIHPPPAADDALDVLGGPGPADGEQPLFGLGRGDPGQRANLRVRELAMRERVGEPR